MSENIDPTPHVSTGDPNMALIHLEERLDQAAEALDELGDRIEVLQREVDRRYRAALVSVALQAIGLFALLCAATWVVVHVAAR
jgi:hypothetical protein